ncbi:hypothetical protein MMC14_006579 [Varicellaria rhodocarpa]|nr:hypothetical protein [Varicellaria rhodocarpa]
MAHPTLLTLPVEIRICIYALLGLQTTPCSSTRHVKQEGVVKLWVECYLRDIPKPPLPTFLRTCLQIYHEAIGIYRTHEHVHVGLNIEELEKYYWYCPIDPEDPTIDPKGLPAVAFRNEVPAAVTTCKNMVLSIWRLSPTRSLYRHDPSENTRKAIAYTKDLLGGLHVEKIQIKLGVLYGHERVITSLYVNPLQLQDCLEEIPGLKMFRITDMTSSEPTSLMGPRQKSPNTQHTSRSNVSA